MKAISILENENVFDSDYLSHNRHIDINGAIKELKDLQNRSCATCKYNKKQDDFMIFCAKEMCQDGSKMMWHNFTKDFSCKYWESK